MAADPAGDDSTDPGALRALLLEDEPRVADLVRNALEGLGYDVAHAASLREARRLLADAFDVAVLDVGLPDGRGFEIVEALRRGPYPCAVVMMTGEPDGATVARSISEGITEFLPKPFRIPKLSASVERAAAMTRNWRGRMAEVRDAHPGSQPPPPPTSEVPEAQLARTVRDLTAKGRLTERESEALRLVLLGFQNNQIATELGISANTVKYHLKNMFAKLELESRGELLRLVVGGDDAGGRSD